MGNIESAAHKANTIQNPLSARRYQSFLREATQIQLCPNRYRIQRSSPTIDEAMAVSTVSMLMTSAEVLMYRGVAAACKSYFEIFISQFHGGLILIKDRSRGVVFANVSTPCSSLAQDCTHHRFELEGAIATKGLRGMTIFIQTHQVKIHDLKPSSHSFVLVLDSPYGLCSSSSSL